MPGWDLTPAAGLTGHRVGTGGVTSHDALAEFFNGGPSQFDVYAPNYGVVADGVTDDGPALRAAINAAEAIDADGRGRVILPPGIIRVASAVTDLDGDTTAVPLETSRLFLVGQGRGSGRSGSSGRHGTTTILIDVACEYGVKFRSENGNPDWRGGGIRDLHIHDNNDYVTDAVLAMKALNDFEVMSVSVSGAGATNAKGFRVLPASNTEPSQYGRIWHMDIWDCYHGMWFESATTGNPVIPDWKILGCQIQRNTTGTAPTAGTIGVYINSNAVSFLWSEVQNFDTGVVIDCVNGRGKHNTLQGIHFEMHTSWNSNSVNAAIEIRSHTSSQNNNILIDACETPSPGKYKTDGNAPSGSVIKVTGTPANVTGVRIQNFRIRDFAGANAWITTTSATLFIDGGGSWGGCEVNTMTAVSNL